MPWCAFLRAHYPADLRKPAEAAALDEIRCWYMVLSARLACPGLAARPWRHGALRRQAVIYMEEFEQFGAARMPEDPQYIMLLGPSSSATAARRGSARSCPGSSRASTSGARATVSPMPDRTSPALQTRAVLDGEEWVINGQKIWTTLAQDAGWIFMLVRTDPAAQAGHQLHAGADEQPRRPAVCREKYVANRFVGY